jgi:hypothetical protein
MSEWKVKIERPVWGDVLDLYLFRHVAEGEVELMSQDSSGQQIIVRIKTYETIDKIKPTLRIGGRESNEILKAFAEAAQNQGVATDQDAKIAGLLEATKAHLEDMRRLVFKPLGSEK